MGVEVNYKAVLVARLDDEDVEYLATFDCIRDDDDPTVAGFSREMNEFLRTEALDQQAQGLNTTSLLYYKGDLAAYVSVCADSIRLNESEQESDAVNYSTAPAIKIARLAVDKRFAGHGFGKFLIGDVRYACQELNDRIGIRFLTLDAFPHRVEYYEKLGFRKNLVYATDKRKTYVSMRSDYRDSEEEKVAEASA